MLDAKTLTDQDMRRLTAQQRKVLLRRRSGQPWRRICIDLRISQDAAKALVSRATLRLQRDK